MWRSAWGHTPYDNSAAGAVATGHTQKMTFQNNLDGHQIRLRFFNLYGDSPLCFDEVWVETAGQKKRVTLEGNGAVAVGPGLAPYSDPVELPAKHGKPITVTTRRAGPSAINGCMTLLYGPLNTVEVGGELFLPPTFPPESMLVDFGLWFHGISDVEVLTGAPAATLAVIGDSIVQMSCWTGPMTLALYRRWPGRIGVVNRGIGGNRILAGGHPSLGIGNVYGQAAVGRFERDVFGGPGPGLVLLHEGVNDLHFGREDNKPVAAAELIAGMKKLARIAHGHGAKLAGCTILPAGRYSGWGHELEPVRTAVNRWIMETQDLDAAFDLAAFVADGENPAFLGAAWDSGDGIHPSLAGGQHIAESLDYDEIGRLLCYSGL